MLCVMRRKTNQFIYGLNIVKCLLLVLFQLLMLPGMLNYDVPVFIIIEIHLIDSFFSGLSKMRNNIIGCK